MAPMVKERHFPNSWGYSAWVSQEGESAPSLTLSRLPIRLVLPNRICHSLSATQAST